MDGKKGAVEGVAIPRINNSAGRRETTGFLRANGRGFSREGRRAILWHAKVGVWWVRDVVMSVLPFEIRF
jgi:hypothetical protein